MFINFYVFRYVTIIFFVFASVQGNATEPNLTNEELYTKSQTHSKHSTLTLQSSEQDSLLPIEIWDQVADQLYFTNFVNLSMVNHFFNQLCKKSYLLPGADLDEDFLSLPPIVIARRLSRSHHTLPQ